MRRPIESYSPASTFEARTEQLVRLQWRVSSGTTRDESNEQLARVKAFGHRREDVTPDEVSEFMATVLECTQRAISDSDIAFQLFFCRHVDNFQIFLEALLGVLARRNPSLLYGVKLGRADQQRSEHEQTQARLRKLSFMQLQELQETVSRSMQFDLFESDGLRDELRLIYDVRNLITHNYGIVDTHFFSRHPTLGSCVGEVVQIDTLFTLNVISRLVDTAHSIERRAAEQFGFSFRDGTSPTDHQSG